ncbi:MAG: peptidoglycan-associated lipoprotein Pal [Proteobacteria bacterium]|nr:peptidoglycan-associated lipoprotein Pal [Desulfobacteraceae bacterium]MBU3981430.1 peptidoglycan-associated lipoprotein Pal [Pseudomonadota bacterium]MBU4013969.1 peptidoglycan-associated lipoprotein Pal [Pseudomonadota bacterium]MBU4067089.1 peptidoglycan-associated lipoprotein Pal [Pseudomonadota bacterium]MBU4100157.1 peptidoglycan-associated lipoprotein Pal [Pseudomonadota bacterium]
MKKKLWICVALLLVIPGLLFVTSCAKKVVKVDTTQEDEAAKLAAEKARQEEIARQLDRQRAIDEENLQKEAASREIIAARNLFMNENIYFDFDMSNLKPESQEVLKRKAEWLRNNPGESIIVEGHCDERGTNEYNLALGDRRAQSAKNFLIDLGIAESRLTTISYGEERPADPRQNEDAWSKNRRDQFVIE